MPPEDVYTYESPAESAVDKALARLGGKYRAVVHLYAEGLFHIQAKLDEKLDTDNHCWLWRKDAAGNRLECPHSTAFLNDGEKRRDYDEYVFDSSPDALANYTLHSGFCVSSRCTTEN